MSIKREGVSFQIIYNYIHILVEYLWGVSQNLSWLLQWTLCSNLVVNIKDPKHSKDIIFHSLGYITKLYIQYFGQSLFFTIMVNWWSTNQKVFTFSNLLRSFPVSFSWGGQRCWSYLSLGDGSSGWILIHDYSHLLVHSYLYVFLWVRSEPDYLLALISI